MQDRVATYPNRWKLAPVAGETDVYDFERADEPVIAGTPLDKATFLTDATAALIAALTGNTPTLPTEALDELAGVFNDIGITGIAHIETGSYVGTGRVGGQHVGVSLTFNKAPKLLIVGRSGTTFTLAQNYFFLWIDGMAVAAPTGSYGNTVTVSGSDISWISDAGTQSAQDALEMNISSTTYYYFAITE